MLPFSTLLLLILVMRFGPDIPIKRMLNEHLVERPALWLSERKRHDFLFLVIISVLLVAGGPMLLMFGPEFMIIYAADLTLYLDIVAASYGVTAITSAKATVQNVRSRLAGWRIFRALRPFRAAARERASPRKPGTSRGDNDDEGRGPQLRRAA